MSEIDAIYTVWLREMIIYIRQKERILASLAMPIFWLLIFGNSLRVSINLDSGLDYITFVAPGIIAMSLLFNSVSSGISIIWDKELGFMKEMLVAPVSRVSLVLGKALGTATTSLIQGTIVLIISILVGLKVDVMTFIITLPLMVLVSLGLVGIGISIGSLMNTIEGFQLVVNFIIMPMFFLSGALFPLKDLPTILRVVTYFNPMTYNVELLRYVLAHSVSIPFFVSLTFVVVFSVLMIFLSAYLFSKKS